MKNSHKKTNNDNESDGDTNRRWCVPNAPQSLVKETGGIGNRKYNRNPIDYRNSGIG